MADRHQVHAQLVRAAGLRFEQDAAGIVRGIVGQTPIAGQRGLPNVIDLLQRPPGPVGNQRQVDLAFPSGNSPATIAT